jgi:hypothetical protein
LYGQRHDPFPPHNAPPPRNPRGRHGALLVPSAAQAASAPTVEVDVADHSITVEGADQLGRGPVRLHLSGESLDDTRTIAVVELKRGVTAHAAEHDLDRLAEASRLVAGGNVSAEADYTTTITARAREHLVLDVSVENGAEARFTVGDDGNGARLPKSDATIGLRDKGFYLPSELPADGILRIANQGDLPHEVTAFRLPKATSYAEARRLLIHGRDLERLGTATVLSGLVSAGTVNRVEATLHRGRYLVASLYAPLTLNGRPDVLRNLIAATRVR